MWRVSASAVLAAGLAWAAASPGLGGEKYAFLVAVGDYPATQLRPLKYSRNDILEFHKVLLEYGYKSDHVVMLIDDVEALKAKYARPQFSRYLPAADNIRKEFKLLLSALEEDDTLVVAFVGHSVQYRDEKATYFCPQNVELEDPKRTKLVSFAEMYKLLESCPARRKLLLADCFRKNPLSAAARTTEKVKLEPVAAPHLDKPPKGLVALFSCAPGQEAHESRDLKHGVFFYHVLQSWRGAYDDGDGEITLDELIAGTKSKTASFTRLKLAAVQTPREVGSVDGIWRLRVDRDLKVGTKAGQVWAHNGLKMKFCWCPSGRFAMGSPKSEKDRDETDEGQVQVTLSRGFWIGKHEVTQGQWRMVITDDRRGRFVRGYGRVGSDYPATYVSWKDAARFCVEFTKKERFAGRLPANWEYRLPTGAQWEYACRAGSTTAYNFSDDAARLGDYAWFVKNTYDIDLKYPQQVGLKLANRWGIHDMHGNVWEWCRDWYQAELPGGTDPEVTKRAKYRVLRGGAWDTSECRCAARVSWPPDRWSFSIGFRVTAVQVGE